MSINQYIVFIGILCFFSLTGCSLSAPVSLEEAMEAAAYEENVEEAIETTMHIKEKVFAYVCGAVCEPGVYALEGGSRIVQAVEAAGGFLPDAAKEAINLAQLVTDGMQITIPTMEEYEETQKQEKNISDGKINLNTAGVTELCTLQGIGQSKAEAIIAYRRELGGYSSIEQLKEVSGIGDNLLEQIRAYVYIE